MNNLSMMMMMNDIKIIMIDIYNATGIHSVAVLVTPNFTLTIYVYSFIIIISIIGSNSASHSDSHAYINYILILR